MRQWAGRRERCALHGDRAPHRCRA
jgi:hypothetical protein